MRHKILVISIVFLGLVACASTQNKVEKQRAKDPQYQYNVGLVYLQNDKYDEAIEYLNKSLVLKPNFDMALNALGIVYFIKADFPKAKEYFEKCLAVNPELTEARNYLGSVYQEMGLLDEAEAEFKKAIKDETYRSRELPYYNLARLNLTRGNDAEALKMVEAAIKFNDKMVMALNLKGILMEKQGNLTEAIFNYEKALKIAPEDINLNYNLAVAYFKSDRRAEAKSLFEKIYPVVTDEEIKSKIDEYLKVLK